jgi:uncharacterized repeat protein (TIGR01451 family)
VRAYLRSSQFFVTVGVLVLVAALLESGRAYAQKEFLIVGTVDCGVPSGRRCSIDDVLRLWTSDVTGERARFVVDVSWVKSQLGSYDQDDGVCIEVRAMPDGTLQALGISQTCGKPDPTRKPTKETDDRRDEAPTATPTPTRTPVTASPEPVDPSADLRIAKTGELICPEGCIATFTVTLHNDGPSAATNVVVGEFYNDGELECEQFSTVNGEYDTEADEWRVGTLAAGASATLDIFCFANFGEGTEGFENEVEVISVDQQDPDSTPNNDEEAEDDQATVFLPAD